MLTRDLTRAMVVGHLVTIMQDGRPGTVTIDGFDFCGPKPCLFYTNGRNRRVHLSFQPDLAVERGGGTFTIRDPELGTVIIGPAPGA